MNRSIETRLAKLEERIAPPGPEKWVEILVHPWLGETIEGQQAAYLAGHPEDVGCSWVIRRIIRSEDMPGANDDAV